ncbi:uncharacterized protein LOC126916961 isoform X2 [Bombus affinis]|uniref:Uncharacterized protein LOC100651242 isoform X2 n=1 Tax=Bombus terrestris TaxID=30195 RepID=A0A9B0BVU0_BOMTE|nr:uncharacterized protein LOC100651242 isoform X2 [Bombus terrestris]XP_050579275.1 uncharacterized protein LOC126916961 isoform X2 [Bombus affinis]
MIVLAWSLFVLVSLLVATNQAFLAAPVSVHGAPSYDVTSVQSRLETNEVIHKVNNNHQQPVDLRNDDRDDGQTLYVIEFESESNEKEGTNEGKDPSLVDNDGQNPLDPWSIVWYIGSFGGLVAFFLIVSCSEWCCRRGGRPLTVPYAQRAEAISGPVVTETPPPPYHLFAPPPYDSVNYGEIVDKTAGEKLDIYVISVPIHRPVVQAPA